VLTVLGFLGSLLLGRDVIPLVLGRAYGPVVPNMIALATAMLLLPLLHVCSLLSLTHDRPGTLLKAALLRLLFFWALGLPLVIRWGSLGACISICVAFVVQAVYFIIKNREEVGPAFVRWVIVVVAGLLFLPLAWLRSSPGVDVALFFVAAGGFLLVLRGLGVVSTRELAVVYRSLVTARSQRRAGGAT
jgi:O-antigen/teichoic acid export membrane protein